MSESTRHGDRLTVCTALPSDMLTMSLRAIGEVYWISLGIVCKMEPLPAMMRISL